MRRLLKLLIWIVVLYFLISWISGKNKGVTFSFLNPSLAQTVESLLKDSEGRYGIFIKNLKDDKTFAQREHQAFEATSLYKIWVMGTVFEQIKEGKITEDESLQADISALNKKFAIDEEDAELEDGVLDLTINSALEQMITISHNYAALALIDKVGRENVENFLKKYNLAESELGSPFKTTPSDMGKLLEKIYLGEVVDVEYSQKMLDILSRQQINDRLPKYLPAATLVAHKTGNLNLFENDAGIVYSPAGNYIIVVLTETNNPLDAREKIARISEVVYKYFNK